MTSIPNPLPTWINENRTSARRNISTDIAWFAKFKFGHFFFVGSLLGLLTILDERLPISLRCYMGIHRIQCRNSVFSPFYNTCIFCSLVCQYYRTLYTPQSCNKHKNHSRANKELPKDQRSKPNTF
jgi:hypothetical protein